MNDPFFEQWHATWNELGVAAPDVQLYHTLLVCYGESHRHYHTLQHLQECFDRLEEARTLAIHPAEISLALWFHDAIYATNRQDNEERCAQWARASAVQAALSAEVAQRLYDLVMATKHNALPVETDATLMVDIDLAILGAGETRFDEYEAQVRQEYAAVPDLLFRAGRSRILQAFQARPRIYLTRPFYERYEAQARANLARSLQKLAG